LPKNNLQLEIETALESEIIGVQNLKTKIENDVFAVTKFFFELNPQTYLILGSGKSGYVAARFAASLRSIGLNAHFLQSGELLHGDVGAFLDNSAVIMFSNSGNTYELVRSSEIARERRVPVIAFLGNPNSNIGRCADYVIDLSSSTNLEYSNFLPTVSITSATAAANCLLIGIAYNLNKSATDFARNHPEGSLGGFLGIPIVEVMTPIHQVAQFEKHSTVNYVAQEMTKFPKGVAIMKDEKNLLLGLLTDGDMRRILAIQVDNEISIEKFITYTPTVIDIGETLATALSTMTSNKPKRISVLPVTEDGEIVGVITMNDIEQRRNINVRS
jgi:arabinose-5-phosphate isomerase